MKPAVHLFTLCAVVCACLLAGCSKSKKKKAPPPTATNAAPQKAAAPAKPKEMVELKAKVPVGKKLVQRIEISRSGEVTAPNQPKPTKTTFDLAQEVSLSVVAASGGGGYEMEMEILSVKIETKAGDKTQSAFDSSQDRKLDAKSPLAKDFRKLVGCKVKLLADAGGKVEKVDGYQAFIGKATRASSAQAVSMVRSMFSEEALKQMSLTHQVLPDKPVAIGESWTTQNDQAGGLKIEKTYTVKGHEEREGRKCIAVETKGSITRKGAAGGAGPADAAGAPPGGAGGVSAEPGAAPTEPGAGQPPAAPPGKPGELGALTGTLWFDPAAGLIVEFQVENKTGTPPSTLRTVNKLIQISDLAK